ncbi:MAG TPA: hypothetical protein PKK43_03495 [Spirochaetota bacterium]|nr:hypothetical protein [Spirochaetota bacterium]
MKKIITLLALAALVLCPASSGIVLFAQEDADTPSDNGTIDNGKEKSDNGNAEAQPDDGDDQNTIDAEGETIDESDLNEVDPWLLETDPPNTKPKE